MIGSVIDGKYEVKELLGQGGMGSVYAVEHTGTGRRCAVKVINSADLVKDKGVLSRFEREARAAGAIDTQYIAQVLDAGIDRQSGLPFLAMEFLDGEDLQHLLKRVGPVSVDLALRIVAHACLGLQKAHAQSVVHRDIKPHNLFLAKRDAGEVIVKLLDFGIAKVKMDQAQTKDGADLTKTGNLLGSPLYVSPEQARGKRAIDHRTDIYSIGAVLYQMLCGRTPYEHASALGELILMVCTEPPPPVQDHAPWIAPEVAAIVHRCLEKSPDQRFQSAQELLEAVQPHLPYGWGIHEDMLVSLADSQRRERAPRLPMSIPPPAITTAAGAAVTAATSTGSDGASTTGPMTQIAAMPAATERWRAPVAAASIGLAAVAAGAGWVLTRTPDAPVAAATAQAAPQPVPDPPPSSDEVDEAPDKASSAKSVRVRVVILPANASIEVEGARALARDGILEIEGALGSVYRVRVFQGQSETTADVVVTEAGALPPKIEVKPGQKIHVPRAGSSGAPVGSDVPAPVPKGIKEDQGEFD